MQLEELVQQTSTALVAEIRKLQERVKALEKSREVPPVLRLNDVPAWYQAATGAPEPPISVHQLRRWKKRPEHFDVDWLLRDGRSLYVDCHKLVDWLRRMPPGTIRLKGGRRAR